MDATAPGVPAAGIGSRCGQTSWWSTSALFRDDAGRNELRLTVSETGTVTAAVFGPDVEGFGVGTATLFPVSSSSATCAATIVLTGHDVGGDHIRQLELTVGATWTLDRSDDDDLEVSGTATLIDSEQHTLVGYRAVRRHPYNRLDPKALPPSSLGAIDPG